MKKLVTIGTDLNALGYIERAVGHKLGHKGPAHLLALLTQVGIAIEARGYKGDRGAWVIGGWPRDNVGDVKDASRWDVNILFLDADRNVKKGPAALLGMMPFSGIAWGTKSDNPETGDRHCRIAVFLNDYIHSQAELLGVKEMISGMLDGAIPLDSSKNINKQSDLPLIRSELAWQEGTLFDLKDWRKKNGAVAEFNYAGTEDEPEPEPVMVIGSPQRVGEHLVNIIARQIERIRDAREGGRNDTCASAASTCGSAWIGADANGATISEQEILDTLRLAITSRDWDDADKTEMLEVVERQFAWGKEHVKFADMGMVEQDALLTRIKVLKRKKPSNEAVALQYSDNLAQARYNQSSSKSRGDKMPMLRFDEAYRAKTGKELAGPAPNEAVAPPQETQAVEAPMATVHAPFQPRARIPITPPKNAKSAKLREIYVMTLKRKGA